MIAFIYFISLLIIFRNWLFSFSPISSGDFNYPYHEQLLAFLNPPFLWESFRNLGFGGTSFINQGLYLYNLPLGIFAHFVDYGISERLVYFIPILLLGVFSIYLLVKILHITQNKLLPLASFIYFLNTYSLIVISGGQITVVFGYITVPLVLATFILALRHFTRRFIILFGLALALLVAFDYRFTYIFFLIAFFYCLFFLLQIKTTQQLVFLLKKYVVIFFFGGIIVFFLHIFWLLPFLSHFSNPVASTNQAYVSTNAVEYFSFAKFENSLSLLHPLWPENIFGKVSFMKPQYLIIPLLAFASLFFIGKKKKQVDSERESIILFFCLLGLVGAFLAKGASDPFGGLYVWMFHTIPGFVMFRDPTKWYTLVAIAYAVLIPFSVERLFLWLQSQPKFLISNIQFLNSKKNEIIFRYVLGLLMFSYLLFLIWPAITGQLGGTLNTVVVPQEYTDVKNFLENDTSFSRVLWLPTMQRFAYGSDTHPGIPAKDYFSSYNEYGVVRILRNPQTEQKLREASVKYVVLIDDTQKEIYIHDRMYNPQEYTNTLAQLRKISWLTEVKKFGNIVVFQIKNPRPLFWIDETKKAVSYRRINSTEYEVKLPEVKRGEKLIFSQQFDSGWEMTRGDSNVQPRMFNNILMSFELPSSGNYTVQILFKPQQLIPVGLLLSSVTLIVLVSLLFLDFKRK